jgi:hypothetical protein
MRKRRAIGGPALATRSAVCSAFFRVCAMPRSSYSFIAIQALADTDAI